MLLMRNWNFAVDWDNLSDGLLLLRGFRARASGEVVILSSPSDRSPVHMPLVVQVEIDNWFELRFGVRFRQRSLFCTGSMDVARDYARSDGEVRALRPNAVFSFCWSPLCVDLYGAYMDAVKCEPITDLLERLQFKCDDLSSAIRSGHEIMLVCDSVLAQTLVAPSP